MVVLQKLIREQRRGNRYSLPWEWHWAARGRREEPGLSLQKPYWLFFLTRQEQWGRQPIGGGGEIFPHGVLKMCTPLTKLASFFFLSNFYFPGLRPGAALKSPSRPRPGKGPFHPLPFHSVAGVMPGRCCWQLPRFTCLPRTWGQLWAAGQQVLSREWRACKFKAKRQSLREWFLLQPAITGQLLLLGRKQFISVTELFMATT